MVEESFSRGKHNSRFSQATVCSVQRVLHHHVVLCSLGTQASFESFGAPPPFIHLFGRSSAPFFLSILTPGRIDTICRRLYHLYTMDTKTIEAIKQDLLKEKERLESELGNFAKKDSSMADNYTSDFPKFGNDEDENANEVAEYSDRLAVEHTLEKQLKDVHKALKKIVDGTYGICDHCGESIGEERLKIRPTSTSCVSCKKRLTGEVD